MATKQVEVKLSVGAIMAISEPLRRGAKDVGKFQEEVTSRLKKLDNIKVATRAIDAFEKLNEQRKANNKTLDKARDKFKELHKEINAGGKISKKLRKEYEAQGREVERLERKQSDLNSKVAASSRGLNDLGISTRNLAGAKSRLANEFENETSAIKQNTSAYDANKKKLEALQEQRKKFDTAMSKARDRLVTGFGLMHGGKQVLKGLWNPMQAAISAEEAFAEVRKVVDFSGDEEMKAFQTKIMDMSKKVPMSIAQLYQLVAAAGQSGIPKDELIEFTSLASRVGVAFGISADEAGDGLAGVRTALGLTIEETGLYMDAINHLSNKMAAKAPHILNFAQRTVGDFKNFGLAKEEALAFGAAMLAAKVPIEVAATSFRNMGKMLARGSAATKSQREGFKAIGLDAEDVSKRLQSDALGTIFDVMERLKNLSDDRRATVQSQILGDEARGIGALVQNVELLKEALGLVSSSDMYSGSGMDEYANRIETTAAKLQIFQNQMDALKIAFAETLLPTLTNLVEKLGKVVNWISTLAKEYPGLAEGLGIAVAAAGGLTIAAGAAVNAIAVAGVLGALKRGGWNGLLALTGDVAGNFDRIGKNAKSASRDIEGGFRSGRGPGSPKSGGPGGIVSSVFVVGMTAAITHEIAQAIEGQLDSFSDGFKENARKEQENLEKSSPLLGKFNRVFIELLKGKEFADDLLGPKKVIKSADVVDMAGAPAGETARAQQSRFAATLAATADNIQQADVGGAMAGQAMTIKQSPIDVALREKADQIRAVRFSAPSGTGKPVAVDLPGRAKGGPVKAGHAYMVGEEGPEPFVPGQDGTIIPNQALRGSGSQAGGVSINAPITIHAAAGMDEGRIATLVQQKISEVMQRALAESYQSAEYA